MAATAPATAASATQPATTTTVVIPATPSSSAASPAQRTTTELQAECLGGLFGPGSPLGTPRIDISRASSSSQQDDSSPERELTAGELGPGTGRRQAPGRERAKRVSLPPFSLLSVSVSFSLSFCVCLAGPPLLSAALCSFLLSKRQGFAVGRQTRETRTSCGRLRARRSTQQPPVQLSLLLFFLLSLLFFVVSPFSSALYVVYHSALLHTIAILRTRRTQLSSETSPSLPLRLSSLYIFISAKYYLRTTSKICGHTHASFVSSIACVFKKCSTWILPQVTPHPFAPRPVPITARLCREGAPPTLFLLLAMASRRVVVVADASGPLPSAPTPHPSRQVVTQLNGCPAAAGDAP
ncbi:uncharacterized protein LOC127752216 [Frankliniella occidentalis]|uniref:Uncharacterized protein LOC127752216 n=1 Tax=Frankliniella occidentalis TaxID=133901 RepID=A0A9C6XVJ9_FRAOC|nr:uncharacterized protein LOC127752216 [Frankliniella occidentalis]